MADGDISFGQFIAMVDQIETKQDAAQTTLNAISAKIIPDASKTWKVGAKTVSTTAAEIFAGSSKLANRYAIAIQNIGAVNIEIGDATLTIGNGFVIAPGDIYIHRVDPGTTFPIYTIAQSNCSVRVVEVA
jgi:hypothetical protein